MKKYYKYKDKSESNVFSGNCDGRNEMLRKILVKTNAPCNQAEAISSRLGLENCCKSIRELNTIEEILITFDPAVLLVLYTVLFSFKLTVVRD